MTPSSTTKSSTLKSSKFKVRAIDGSRLAKFHARLLRYIRFTKANPAWFLMFLISRVTLIRRIVTTVLRQPDLTHYLENESLFLNLDVEQAVQSIRQHGYYSGIQLPQAIVDEILEFAYSTKLTANRDTKSPVRYLYHEKDQAEAQYGSPIVYGDYQSEVNHCPALKTLETDPKLLSIAAGYLGRKPEHNATRLCWSFKASEQSYKEFGSGATVFHYDPDDYCTLKFFFYLTDVDSESGPHSCVRGSHQRKKLKDQLTFMIGRTEDEISRDYGAENIVTFCGKAGFGFAEDVFCYHRGSVPTGSDRLLLQIQFSMHNYKVWHQA